ncbi:MAG TPA: hypothetical protein VMR19_01140 [Candidatus Saccharimonadales bacterium]|jgi:hypothetical protein|nr:hypothetical protein [Candidatus Saccharimonadales bacterium]
MPDCSPGISPGGKYNIATISNLSCLFSNLVTAILGLAGIALFVLLLVGGFKFITSGGDPKALEGAKGTITSAIIGLVVILVSYLILILISNITGVDVTKFNVVLP